MIGAAACHSSCRLNSGAAPVGALIDLAVASVVIRAAGEVGAGNGGGWGNPAKRSKEKVIADIKNGYITQEQAQVLYQHG